MRSPKVIYLIIFVFLSACSGAPEPTRKLLTPTQSSPILLPPTWTLTVTSIPSETPIRHPTQTFTPLPSTTLLPATLTPNPTSNVPTLTATPTLTPTVDTSCNITALDNSVPLLTAPNIDPYRVLPTLPTTITYQAATWHAPYYELTLFDKPVGWVDSGLPGLTTQGQGCDLLPTDTRKLTDFPSLCLFVPDGEVNTYADRALTEPYQTITSTNAYPLLLRYSDVFYTSASESGPGFFVDADQVSTLGPCESVPYAGLVFKDSWLWSQPDGEIGKQLGSLRPGQRIFIQKGPIVGARPPDISRDGAWFFVLVSPRYEGRSGWVWSSDIFIE